MDATSLVPIVQSLGFPIVACGAMFWMLNKERDQRKEENAKLSEALNNNTIALTKLVERLDK